MDPRLKKKNFSHNIYTLSSNCVWNCVQ